MGAQIVSLTRRGRYYHFDFIYRGVRHQGSTNQTNINKARLTEAKIRSDVALEHFGVGPAKVSPLFKDFMETRFLPHVRQHNAPKKRTVLFYEEKTRRLLEYTPFSDMRMSDIDEEAAASFALWRQRPKLGTHTPRTLFSADVVDSKMPTATHSVSIATINGELRTLRKAVLLAYEWRLIQRRPRIRTLPGENKREFVLTREMEAAYLAVADYPLKQAAILMLDLGLRPEECVSLRKTDIIHGGERRYDEGLDRIAALLPPTGKVATPAHKGAVAAVNPVSLFIRSGKTKNAVRALPLTERCAEAVQFLFDLWPQSEWLFPGKKGRHYTRGALDNAHADLLKRSAAKTIRDSTSNERVGGMPTPKAQSFQNIFVLYTFRHSYATRLAESGADVFTIQKVLGHASIITSQRYVHPSNRHLELALKRKEVYDKIMRGEAQSDTSEEFSKS